MEKIDFLIVGAGISGLFMGFLFEYHKFNFKIIERDKQFDSRHGYSLTLQAETKKILTEFNLLENIQEIASNTKENLFINGNNKEIIYQDTIEKFNIPIPRQSLRELFHDRLSKNCIDWGKNIIDIIQLTSGQIIIRCSDGTEYQCKYLLGCDGIHSRVRKRFLPQCKLNYLNLVISCGLFKLSDLHKNDQMFFLKRNIQFVDGKNKLFSKPFNNEYYMWEATYQQNYTDEQYSSTFNDIMKIVTDWNISSLFYAIKSTIPQSITHHTLVDYIPNIDIIMNMPRNIFLLGDSLHPMTPSIGMGANEAIMDCYQLIKYLVSNKNNLENVFKIYYQEVIYRNSKTVEKSRRHTLFYQSENVIDPDKFYQFKKN